MNYKISMQPLLIYLYNLKKMHADLTHKDKALVIFHIIIQNLMSYIYIMVVVAQCRLIDVKSFDLAARSNSSLALHHI